MAGEQTVSGVAGRYAKALFELGLEANALDKILNDLNSFHEAMDAAEDLESCLDALKDGQESAIDNAVDVPGTDIIIADGGSTDGTKALAERLSVRVIIAARGRGPQLAEGAAAAAGDWLLFLHADTRLAMGWMAALAGFGDSALTPVD